MGQELDCKLRFQDRMLAGKAHLETDHLLFRGGERVKVLFRDLTRVTAASGLLKLEFPGGPAEFELGAAAEKWAHKILHPPSRLEKLGIKPGVSVHLAGEFAPDFVAELRAAKAEVSQGVLRSHREVILFAATAAADLEPFPRMAAKLKPDGALWVVYPKGVAVIREVAVIGAGRAAGLKDVKVAAFSATHTALKFVIPVAAR